MALGPLKRDEADLSVDLCRHSILEGPDSKYLPTQRASVKGWASCSFKPWNATRAKGMVVLQTQASLHLLPLLQRQGYCVLKHRLAEPDKDLQCA